MAYPVDGGTALKCISDTAGTAVTTFECALHCSPHSFFQGAGLAGDARHRSPCSTPAWGSVVLLSARVGMLARAAGLLLPRVGLQLAPAAARADSARLERAPVAPLGDL